MTPEVISLSVIASFLVILVFGFLFGLIRGFNKSLVRSIIVIACLVVTFFCVPAITSSVMKADISNFNVVIDGEIVTSVGEALTTSLAKVEIIADIVDTQAFATIITVLPQMIVNVILFVVLFYVIRLVSMIIYWIIAGICFNRKKMKGKNKHRLLGGLVGLVQNFVIFLVLLVPCVGVINLVSDLDATLPQTTTTATASTTATISGSDNGEEVPAEEQEPNEGADIIEEESTSSSSSSFEVGTIKESLGSVNEVLDAYRGTWVFKFLHGVKLDSACNAVFNSLTTVKVDKVKYNLHDEVVSIATVFVDFTDMQAGPDEKFSLTSTETIDKLEKLINDAYKSKLTANLIDEVIPKAATKWKNGETFMGIAKPTMEGYDKVIDDILAKLGEPGSKKELLLSTAKMAKSLVKTVSSMTSEDGKNFSLDDVSTLLKEITSDPVVMDLAKTIVVNNIQTIADKIFEDSSENTYANVVVEAVQSIFNADYSLAENNIEKEINVLSTTLKFADKLNNKGGEGEQPAPIEQEDVNAVINALADSNVIYNTIIAVNNNETASDITLALREAIKGNETITDMLNTALNSLSEDQADKAAELRKVFNLTATQKPGEGEENNGSEEGETENGETENQNAAA